MAGSASTQLMLASSATRAVTAPILTSRAPPYGRRQGFIPRSHEDFGDGGAFPEVHIMQYPLDMGRKDKVRAPG